MQAIFFLSRIFHFPILEECSLHLVGLFTIDLQMKQIAAALDPIIKHCLFIPSLLTNFNEVNVVVSI